MLNPKWKKISWKELKIYGDYEDDFLGYSWNIKELDWEIFVEAEKNNFGERVWIPVISFGKEVDHTKMGNFKFSDLQDAKDFCESWVLKFLKKASKFLKKIKLNEFKISNQTN